MVVRANRAYGELGGHIASYASAAEIFETGFNHFFRGRRRPRRRPRVLPAALGARRLRARVPRRPARPRSSSRTIARRSAAAACRSYPHPWLMPDFWQFPTGSMGIGPISAIYQARFMRYLAHRGLADTGAAPRLGRVRRRRDGRARVDRRADARRAREASTTSPSSSTATCSASTVRCAATARSSRSWKSLFIGAGWNVIKVLWGSRLGRAVRARQRRTRCCAASPRPSTASTRRSAPRTAHYNREHFFDRDPELQRARRAHDRRRRSTR